MSGFELLERRIRAHAIQSFVVGGVTLLIGLGMAGGAAWSALTGGAGSVGFIGLTGLGCLAVAGMLFSNARSMLPPTRADLYRIVANEPERIAWIHGVTGRTNGIRIHLVSGMEHTLPANAADSQALFAFLQGRAPQAILGYGPGQRKRFDELRKARRAAVTG